MHDIERINGIRNAQMRISNSNANCTKHKLRLRSIPHQNVEDGKLYSTSGVLRHVDMVMY